MGAVVTDKKGRVISTAFNSETKSHPTQAFYAKKTSNPYKIYLHAEIAALVKCRKEPYTITIARVNKRGELRMAKPCQVCLLAIRETGIREIVYSSEEGWWRGLLT